MNNPYLPTAQVPGMVWLSNFGPETSDDAVRFRISQQFGIPLEDIQVLRGLVPNDLRSIYVDQKYKPIADALMRLALIHQLLYDGFR